MENYKKLISVLNNQSGNNISNEIIKKNKFRLADSFFNLGLLDFLVWKLNTENNTFKLMSSSFGYDVSTSNFESFIKAIKPCFRDYFINFLSSYIQFITNKGNVNVYQFQSFLPVKLNQNGYSSITLYIIPEMINNNIIQLYFIMIPLNKNDSDIISFQILKNNIKDNHITSLIKNTIPLANILTKNQSDIFLLILRGYSSKKIAANLNKKQNNILKYNIRIKDRLSCFFDLNFNNVMDATKYYKDCFLSI